MLLFVVRSMFSLKGLCLMVLLWFLINLPPVKFMHLLEDRDEEPTGILMMWHHPKALAI